MLCFVFCVLCVGLCMWPQLGIVVAFDYAAGIPPQYQGVNVRFVHCFYLDQKPLTKMATSKVCWFRLANLFWRCQMLFYARSKVMSNASPRNARTTCKVQWTTANKKLKWSNAQKHIKYTQTQMHKHKCMSCVASTTYLGLLVALSSELVIYLSIAISVSVSLYLSIYLSYLSIYHTCLSIILSIYLSIGWVKPKSKILEHRRFLCQF